MINFFKLNSDQNSLTEPPLESSKDKKPPANWPQKGLIEFKNVTMRYYQNEDHVLKNLNFRIEADKIGIVGRQVLVNPQFWLFYLD